MLPSPEFIPDAVLERRATELLREHERLSEVAATFPVPIEAIVEQTLNLRIVWVPIEELPGEIILARIDPDYRGHPTIQMNENRIAHFEEFFGTEQFSLAHEAGHWVLHYARGRSRQMGLLPQLTNQNIASIHHHGTSDSRRREVQADRFAAYLLLPELLLRPAAVRHDLLRWAGIAGLALDCGVSKRAMARRLDALGLIRLTPSGDLLTSPATTGQSLF